MSEPLHFTGTVVVQFHTFVQGTMETEAAGNQVFVGVARGLFGTPPNGKAFEARVKLSVGASFVDDAYEVLVPPVLSQLGARPAFRAAAYEYVDLCMSTMLGPHWKRMTGLTATNNVIRRPGALVSIDFSAGSEGW
jgi:hypothetical protein